MPAKGHRSHRIRTCRCAYPQSPQERHHYWLEWAPGTALPARERAPYRDMKVWDAMGSVEGPETLRFDAAEFAVPELGFIVENVLIQDALLAALDATHVSINYENAHQIGEEMRRTIRR